MFLVCATWVRCADVTIGAARRVDPRVRSRLLAGGDGRDVLGAEPQNGPATAGARGCLRPGPTEKHEEAGLHRLVVNGRLLEEGGGGCACLRVTCVCACVCVRAWLKKGALRSFNLLLHFIHSSPPPRSLTCALAHLLCSIVPESPRKHVTSGRDLYKCEYTASVLLSFLRLFHGKQSALRTER